MILELGLLLATEGGRDFSSLINLNTKGKHIIKSSHSTSLLMMVYLFTGLFTMAASDSPHYLGDLYNAPNLLNFRLLICKMG